MKSKEELEKEPMPYDNETPKKCPKCGNWFLSYPALSRRDNSTYICPDCGVKEAMEDYMSSIKKEGLEEATMIALSECEDNKSYVAHLNEDVSWSYYDKFEDIINKYMPDEGEGDTYASQIVTAINKLIYKWYNDGDVYDNVISGMTGWANDLSDYANWLYNYVDGAQDILMSIKNASSDAEYENILKKLADEFLTEEFLEEASKATKEGTIYDCNGPFEFDEHWDDEDEDDYWNEDDNYDEDEEEELDESKKLQEGVNNLTIRTGLTDKNAYDVLSSVEGQLADGIWENSPGMNRFWAHMAIDREGNEVVARFDTKDYSSGFRGKDEAQIKKWLANKVKQIVKEEGLDWNRDNTERCSYMHGKVTVQDAYRVYDKLLGRKDYIPDPTKKTESKEVKIEGTKQKRIARYNEFDNGHVFHSWKEMSDEEAEEKAKEASEKDDWDIYYVAYDDIMNPSSELRWYRGKSYTSEEAQELLKKDKETNWKKLGKNLDEGKNSNLDKINSEIMYNFKEAYEDWGKEEVSSKAEFVDLFIETFEEEIYDYGEIDWRDYVIAIPKLDDFYKKFGDEDDDEIPENKLEKIYTLIIDYVHDYLKNKYKKEEVKKLTTESKDEDLDKDHDEYLKRMDKQYKTFCKNMELDEKDPDDALFALDELEGQFGDEEGEYQELREFIHNELLESKKIKEENINDIFNQISDIVKEVANLDDRFSLLENTDKCVMAGVKLKNSCDWEFRENEKSLNDSTPKIWSDACRYFRKKVNSILAKYEIETLIPERLPCSSGEGTYYSEAIVDTDNFNVWTICDLYDNNEFTVGICLR